MKPLLLLCLALTACVAAPPIETASGRPEVFVDGVDTEQTQARILQAFMQRGWMVKSESKSQLVFWRENEDVLANALLGSRYDPTTTFEARIVISAMNGGSQVYAQAALITNEGSAFESRSDLSKGKGGYDLWQFLLQIESELESTSGSPQAPEQ